MKFSLSWLKSYLETSASLNEIAETLTRIGLEVEAIHDKSESLKPFVLAKVISAVQHPDADKLRVCMVDIGDGKPLQVVCGAPNARAGMVSVFAPPGTYIPAKDITLSIGTIRGQASHGMLCSEFELELSEDHNGIIDLPLDAPVGTKFIDYKNLSDPVIEINLTPNRPDCTSIYGIARDLAASGLGKLKPQTHSALVGAFPCPTKLHIEVEKDHCPTFALRLIKGVSNKPSPQWLQDQLKAIGLRPINALVDVTNFMTFAYGRPLHVFDASKVKGDLRVRYAHAGESFIALDTKTYTMLGGEVVIADDNGIESLAGIMGGELSGCDENTTDVLVESALWSPLNIARTGRLHNINSDARYRFERGIDPQFNEKGLEIASQMIMDFCGGTPSKLEVAGKMPNPQTVIAFPINEVERLTGISVTPQVKRDILTKLGFKVEGEGDVWQVTAPSWRPDIEIKACLVEEITRIVGLDAVQSTPLTRSSNVPKASLTLNQKRMFKSRRLLATRGLVEAVTWSFISHEEAVIFGGGAGELALANPIASDLSDMRPTLLAGLLKACQKNSDKGFSDLALFEVGQVFMSETEQYMAASAVRIGLNEATHDWQGSRAASVYDIKQDALGLLMALGLSPSAIQFGEKVPSFMHPGRSASLQMGPKNILGFFGELHPKIAAQLGLKQSACVFELILDKIPEAKAKLTRVKPKLELSSFMPLERDFAFVVDEAVKGADIVRIAGLADKKLISKVNLFDIYQGKGVEEGKKSLALRVTLQPTDKTLTDDDIEIVSRKVIEEVGKKLGGTLRG